jgi:hypothetical protein
MMKVAGKAKSLAPEQYGSPKHHSAIDLAINKAVTFNILHQLKCLVAIIKLDCAQTLDDVSS